MTSDDLVTGATTRVTMTMDLPPERVWDLVGDVSRIGEWSPECVWAGWTSRAGAAPRAGDRFRARNEYPDGFVATVECVVTAADRPSVFAWVVLDDQGDADRPGSLWRYDLRAAGEGTLVTQTFTHGPGLTGLREGAGDGPAVIAGRLAQLRRNMTVTLRAMAGAAGH
ncbi:SRPBCC family protein [Kitasatospora herbaricolor]|uniref:SRPBCC family protein n=1 Tax=Kitasatospora herbaricolor TaxID=68217 RepID=A0ABZ1WH75_9ACTN|nr:SRPBCC family protein [Kitasatospora herbaricolor]